MIRRFVPYVFKKPTYKLRYVTLILSLVGLLLGMELTMSNVSLGRVDFKNVYQHLLPIKSGFLFSAHWLGEIIGCVGYIAFSSGQRESNVLLKSFLLWLVGNLFTMFSNELWFMFCGKILKGTVSGILKIAIPFYIINLYPRNMNGKILTYIQLSRSIISLLTYYFSIWIENYKVQREVDIVSLVQYLPLLMLIFTCFKLPTTPIRLVTLGCYGEAEETQNQIFEANELDRHKSKYFKMNKFELASIYGDLNMEVKFREVFTGKFRKPILMGIILQSLVQFCGINFLFTFMPLVCDVMGLQGNMYITGSSLPYLVYAIFSIFPIFFLDKVKRKDLLTVGALPCSILMIIIGTIMSMNYYNSSNENGWYIDKTCRPLILGLLLLYISITALTLSSGPVLYTYELLPRKAKLKGMILCLLVSYTFQYLLILLGPLMMRYLKWGTFIMFGCASLFFYVIILLKFPETKNMSPNDIESMLNGIENKVIDELKVSEFDSPIFSSIFNRITSGDVETFGPIELKVMDP